MGSFFSLFHCGMIDGNQVLEDQFQWFAVSIDAEYKFVSVHRSEVERLLSLVRSDMSNQTALARLAKLLEMSLTPPAYDLFVEAFGTAKAMGFFYDDTIRTPEGLIDFAKTKDSHYGKYCFYKFASFLDLLRPGSVKWRSDSELDSIPLLSAGLEHFRSEDVEGRSSMLSRWIRIRHPSLTVFSTKKIARSQQVSRRKSVLRSLENLTAAEVARRLDAEGFKPREYPSYVEYLHTNRNSFEAWLSNERRKIRDSPKNSWKHSR